MNSSAGSTWTRAHIASWPVPQYSWQGMSCSPGFVATFTTTFHKTGEQLMPCHEYCGTGHEAMWARVQVLPPAEFLARARGGERVSCVKR